LNFLFKTSEKSGRLFFYDIWKWFQSNFYGLLLIIGVSIFAKQIIRLEILKDSLSAPVIALLCGIFFTNIGFDNSWAKPSLNFASSQLLKIGVSLLGFRLAFSEILEIGSLSGILVIICVVFISFFLIKWIGGKASVSKPLTLLLAAGFPICGISAIAAVKPLSGADDEETGYAVGLITIFGSISILLFSILNLIFDIEMNTLGWWIGLSVHDTSQVVAAASAISDSSLDSAIVVKMGRILLLAPMLLMISFIKQRGTQDTQQKRFPIPIFILGFIVAAALRSADVLSNGFLDSIGAVRTFLITAAMFGLGSGIRLKSVKDLGTKPLQVGFVAWVTVLILAGVGTFLTIQIS
tara:strand:+ start:3139 stop:4194 length:1056 start_codon:yes stop_codon:yes gene_type:complete